MIHRPHSAPAAAAAKSALQVRSRRKAKDRKIVVHGVVRPQPDLRKLVAAVREMAREEPGSVPVAGKLFFRMQDLFHAAEEQSTASSGVTEQGRSILTI